ncbi:hypothetical protein H4V95_002306 [Arthrobacter sp. CAN_C5]|nr:hypothetical protein [Arthrobacter sp. CAN_C5]
MQALTSRTDGTSEVGNGEEADTSVPRNGEVSIRNYNPCLCTGGSAGRMRASAGVAPGDLMLSPMQSTLETSTGCCRALP